MTQPQPLPEGLDEAYADDATDPTVREHQQHHDRLHAFYNANGGAARTPEQYGAVGDGVADDQAALVAMIAALKPGDRVLLTKRYRHSGVLTIATRATTWSGYGADLLSTDRQNTSLRGLSGAADGTTLMGIRHTVDPYTGAAANARGGSDTSTAPFAFVDCSGITLIDCYSANSAQCGFYLAGVSRYKVVRPVVDRSYADGFHQTHGCSDGRVIDPLVEWPGDDGIAVVSYKTREGADVGPCRRIHVSRAVVRYCHARGMSIVGGDDITYTEPDIFHTCAAGIAIMAESGYDTHTPQRVRVQGGRVAHVGYPTLNSQGAVDPGLDHSALFMLNQQAGTSMTDCGFTDVRVSDVYAEAAGGPCFVYARNVVENGATLTRAYHLRTVVEPGPGPTAIIEARAGLTITGTVDNRPAAGGGVPAANGGRRALSNDVAVSPGVGNDLAITANVLDKGTTSGSYVEGTRGIKIPAGGAGVYDIVGSLHVVGISGLIVLYTHRLPAGTTNVNDEIGEINTTGNADARMLVTTTAYLNVGDEVRIGVYFPTGSGTVRSGNSHTWVQAFRRGT